MDQLMSIKEGGCLMIEKRKWILVLAMCLICIKSAFSDDDFIRSSASLMVKIPEIKADEIPIDEFLGLLELKWKKEGLNKNSRIRFCKTDEYVRGNFSTSVSLDLVDMPIIEIAEIVAQIGNLDISIEGSVITFIGSRAGNKNDSTEVTRFIRLGPLSQKYLSLDNALSEPQFLSMMRDMGADIGDDADIYIAKDPFMAVFIRASAGETELLQSILTLLDRGYMPTKIGK
jgi:hypothetical protein